jgi:hypothetical protein
VSRVIANQELLLRNALLRITRRVSMPSPDPAPDGAADFYVDPATSRLMLSVDGSEFQPLEAGAVSSVAAWGAVGDGVTDDTAAFTAAIAALPASGGVVYIPPGTFLVSGTTGITVGKSVCFIGAGIGVTTITRGSASHALATFTGAASSVVLSDVTWDGATWKKFGIQANGISRLIVSRCEIKRCGIPSWAGGNQGSIDGIRADNVTEVRLDSCRFDSCERDGFLGLPARNLTVTGCRFTNCGRLGVANEQNAGATAGPLTAIFVGNSVEDCGAGGFHTETHASLDVAQVLYLGNRILDCGDDDGWGISYGLIFGNKTAGIALGNVIEEIALTAAR